MGRILEEIKEEVGRKNYPLPTIKIDNYVDNIELFYNIQPFFYDKTNIFWIWNKNKYKYEQADEIDIMNLIDHELGLLGQTISKGIKGNYLEAFKRVGRKHQPTTPEKSWIQFKNKIIDVKDLTEREATPEYFICNPIPWELGTSEETPTIDQLFIDWVEEENKKQLQEIMSYCLIPDYPIHLLFAFIGSGRNGKSRFLELITRFIGRENITSTELDTLLNRNFETAKLYKKLVCLMGETNFETITQTSLLKKLTGQDMIGYEFKQKTPFDDYNYAKIILSTNSLPTSSDASEGFYRRWLIIKFPNDFKEGKDILETIPLIEYNNFAKKSIRILHNLLEKREFTHQGSVEERKERFIGASNPLSIFIKKYCELGENLFVKYGELYTNYVQYLNKHKMRIVSRKEFSLVLDQEGFIIDKTSKKINDDWVNSRFVLGLELRAVCDTCADVSTKLPVAEKLTCKVLTSVTKVTTDDKKSLVVSENMSNLDDDNSKEAQNELLSENVNFSDLLSLLLDKVNKSTNIQNLLDFGFTNLQINTWKSQGLIIENKSGIITLL
jgi:putative DNA primase/helicase